MFLKICRNKKAQLLLEYVLLVVMAILTIIAVEGITKKVRGYPAAGVPSTSFDAHFRQCAAAAGGVVLGPGGP